MSDPISKTKDQAPDGNGKLKMFLATDTAWPWYVVDSDNNQRVPLNAPTHIISKVPYAEIRRPKVGLQKRQGRGDYKETDCPFRLVPKVF
jgi:hypothetical protein